MKNSTNNKNEIARLFLEKINNLDLVDLEEMFSELFQKEKDDEI